MAQLEQSFNTSEMPEGSSFEPLPAGWYAVVVTDAELKANDTGWQGIKMTLQVESEASRGRKTFQQITTRHATSENSVKIGREQLGAIMRASALKQLSDTDQLIGKRFEVKLKITKSEQYGDGNDAVGYRAIEGSAPPAASGGTPSSWGNFK